MNKNQLMTAAALGFAAFSLWYITKGNKTPTSPAPATNYTPCLDALCNRDPVNAPQTTVKFDVLTDWHDGFYGFKFPSSPSAFSLGF